jgi:hypothetical protein
MYTLSISLELIQFFIAIYIALDNHVLKQQRPVSFETTLKQTYSVSCFHGLGMCR